MRSRRTSLVVLGAALALVTSACGGGSDTSTSSSGSGGQTGSSAGPATFQSQHKGGTLHLVAKSAGGTLDPMVNYTLQYWQLYQSTYDGLLAFTKKVGGQAVLHGRARPRRGHAEGEQRRQDVHLQAAQGDQVL